MISLIRLSILGSTSRHAVVETQTSAGDSSQSGGTESGALPRRSLISPLTARRLSNFKKNRRGYWSFWIFTVLFVISLFAEFIANDKPLLIGYQGKLYTPVFNIYPETTFGGFFQTEAEYREKEVQDLILDEGGWMIWPPIRFSYSTTNFNLEQPAPAPPTGQNLLGTDDQARDVLARVIYGFRISVLFGIVLTVLSSIVGIAAGAVQGYFGGWTDLLFQRFIEIWSGMPRLYMLIILASVFIPSFWLLLFLLLLFEWMSLVGVVRAEFLRTRNFEYVRAARALGVKDTKIMRKHVLPNAMTATITFFALRDDWFHYCVDFIGLSGIWATTGLCITWRAAGSGQGQSPCTVARTNLILRLGIHAQLVDLYRRSGSRCIRSTQDL